MQKKTTENIKERAVQAALSVAAEKGWERTSLYDIAKKADISLSTLREHIEDRGDILSAYGRMLDRKVIENTGSPDNTISARDRLFDVLMERFDLLNENRAALTSVLNSFRCDPKQALIGLPHLGRSMNKMLEAATIDTNGIMGAAKVAATTALYVKTLLVWINDESPDMSKTMAALDKKLGHAERLAETLGFSTKK